MTPPVPFTAQDLIAYLIGIGMTLTEQNEKQIREYVIANAAESDRLIEESRQRDEIARQKLAGAKENELGDAPQGDPQDVPQPPMPEPIV